MRNKINMISAFAVCVFLLLGTAELSAQDAPKKGYDCINEKTYRFNGDGRCNHFVGCRLFRPEQRHEIR